MNNRALFQVIGISLALTVAGCSVVHELGFGGGDNEAAEKARHETKGKYRVALKHCATSPCTPVVVTATDCTADGITVDPDVLTVHPKPAVIVWTLVNSPGYAFDNDAIVFKGTTDDNFNCHKKSDTEFECKNKNKEKTPTAFNYKIVLLKGAQRCERDPIIINGY